MESFISDYGFAHSTPHNMPTGEARREVYSRRGGRAATVRAISRYEVNSVRLAWARHRLAIVDTDIYMKRAVGCARRRDEAGDAALVCLGADVSVWESSAAP
ncbi:hypothetical protein EVAR_68376_1 [Eumeta japonica]|uniref:Uncharacterized protein n=1 Tax=Eumeta variegata TaxID=151549 RepID=A0A4C1ZNI4_EUMVA|nr:hypothetical protein EVAR_68376_1 [Eumeta japonica]